MDGMILTWLLNICRQTPYRNANTSAYVGISGGWKAGAACTHSIKLMKTQRAFNATMTPKNSHLKRKIRRAASAQSEI